MSSVNLTCIFAHNKPVAITKDLDGPQEVHHSDGELYTAQTSAHNIHLSSLQCVLHEENVPFGIGGTPLRDVVWMVLASFEKFANLPIIIFLRQLLFNISSLK